MRQPLAILTGPFFKRMSGSENNVSDAEISWETYRFYFQEIPCFPEPEPLIILPLKDPEIRLLRTPTTKRP